MAGPDGTLEGIGVGHLACVMDRMGQPYRLKAVPMSRSSRIEADGLLDIWFPTFDTSGSGRKNRLVGPIGQMSIYWFMGVPGGPDAADKAFGKETRVTAFPGSLPERILMAENYHFVPGTDDENRLLLWLVEGRVDAVLAADFTGTLSPGARTLAGQLRRVLYGRYPVAFELSERFERRWPYFAAGMQKALDVCRRPSGLNEGN